MRIRLFLLLSFMAVFRLLNAQVDTVSMSAPFDFPLLLSGNFGELRSNHFHAGIDFKTQGVTGKHIKAPADGYISRATVTPGGYGLYILPTPMDILQYMGICTGFFPKWPSACAASNMQMKHLLWI